MQVVRGHLQAYPWGPVDGLAEWTPPTGGPQAELWFGTHPNGPSPLRDAPGVATGASPVLLKLLAAAEPLSIQIHPPADLAAQLLAAPGPPLVADPYGKAELLIALQDFLILGGFRPTAVSALLMADLGTPVATVTQALRDDDLPAAIQAALALAPDVVEHAAVRLPAACDRIGLPDVAGEALRAVVARYPRDPGVFVAALLGARLLAPGEAVFVEPGTVHAYVRGLGVEVMTSSDNVLRLGLTTKQVAVDAALRALDITAQPHPCAPHVRGGVHHYALPHAPFTVDIVDHDELPAPVGRDRIVLCLTGTTRVGETVLRPGDALLLSDGASGMTVDAEGVAVVTRDASQATPEQG